MSKQVSAKMLLLIAVRAGVLEVTGATGPQFVSNSLYLGCLVEVDPNLSNALCVSIPDAVSVLSTPIFPLVNATSGQVLGFSGFIGSAKYNYDLEGSLTPTGSNLAFFTQTSLTTVGAPPEEIAPYGDPDTDASAFNLIDTIASGVSGLPFESAIWSIDADAVLTAQWINPPGVTPSAPPTFAAIADFGGQPVFNLNANIVSPIVPLQITDVVFVPAEISAA